AVPEEHDDVADPERAHQLDLIDDQRLVADGQDRLGKPFAERLHAAAAPGGENGADERLAVERSRPGLLFLVPMIASQHGHLQATTAARRSPVEGRRAGTRSQGAGVPDRPPRPY